MKKFALLTTLCLCFSLCAEAQPRRFKHESFTTDTPMVHDPVMAYEDSTYHIYATGMGIQHMTSKDRKTWTVKAEPVMTVIPKWAMDSVPGFRLHVWAPDVIKYHGKWWLAYSCSTFGKNGSAIGLLSNRSLSFPVWEDEGCIVTSREKRNNWNAIDPNFVIDNQDQPWLVWGSFWDGIQLARLDTTMHIAKGEKPRTIARRYDPSYKPTEPNPTSKYAGTNAIEAPFIFKHGGWYYLFVSWDYCCRGSKSSYRVAVGRSKTVDGPYLDHEGKDMVNGGGTLFFEGDKKAFEAAGHCAAYTINGEDIFICHGYSTAHKGAAILIQRPISWTADGWPEMSMADAAMSPTASHAQILQSQLKTNSDEQLLREWIKVLASDEFGGRKPMTTYEDKTVNYLARQLEEIGLEPAFDGSWFQPFSMIAVTAKPVGSKLSVRGRKKTELRYPDDVMVWTARATEKIDLQKAEYVFCGFGINAPEYGWNDYEGIDVRGKIVIAMVNDPGYYDSQLFRGRNMTYYGRWLYKFEEARRQGAAGCLVLHNPEAASYGWHVCVNGHLKDNLALYNPNTRNADELAVKGWLHENGAHKLFDAAGMDMDKAIADAKRPGFKSFSLNVKGDVKMSTTFNIKQTQNVGGILRGSQTNGEAVVLSAHWDHLGIGKPDEQGDTIYNGAADNASGMAGALLTAKKIKQLPQTGRSLLFIFPSSEESGLFGSEYYCSHPVVEMKKTVACLNFESIGPAELTHDVVILGGGESHLDNFYIAAAAAQGRTIYFDNDNSDGWFFRSDHYNFVKKGVPAVVLENGQHPVDMSKPNKYPMPVWYHKPSDEYREDWDLSGTLSNIRLLLSVALSLAN